MARAILFDLDGTVWDSWPWYAQLLHDCGAGPIDDQRTLLAGGEPAAALFHGVDLKASAFKAACTLEPPPLFDGVAEMMGGLVDADVRLGAVTSLPKWLYAPMLAVHGELLAFETVIGWSDARRKPQPDPLELAMEHLSVEPAPEHWYVGDTVVDAEATAAAGMSFGWAAWGYGPDRPSGTRKRLDRPEQVAELI